MPTFSKTSLDRLATCHEDLIIFCNEFIKHYDFAVICGHRGQEEQDKAYAQGFSKLKYPKSKHNSYPSLAVDLAPWEGKIDWGKNQMYFFAGFALGIAEMLYRDGVIKHKIKSGNGGKVSEKIYSAPGLQSHKAFERLSFAC